MSVEQKVFVREATGFVREISIVDALFANLGFMALTLGLLTFIIGPWLFPGGDLLVSTLLCTVLSIFPALMYAFFVWAMPRSGGDYVWVSRLTHPLLGLVLNFNLTFWYVFFGGIVTAWVTSLALSPGLLVVGLVTSNQSLVEIANTLAQPQCVVGIGILITAINALIMARGVRAVFTLNNVLIAISLLGYAVAFWLLVTHTNADFANVFNKYASYSDIISAAHQAGYSPQGPDYMVATLGLMPFIFGTTGYGMISSYFAGELKSTKKNAVYAQVGSVVISGLVLMLLGGLALNVFGYDFLGSITQLAYTGSSSYPFAVPPFFNLFVSLLTDNPAVLLFLLVAYVAAMFTALPATYMITTRNVFAWSFDGAVPAKFSEISHRFRSPIYAILVVVVIELAGLLSYTYGPSSFTALVAGAGAAQTISFIVISIIAIFFPLKKQYYDNTPAKMGKPLPLVSVVAVVSLVFYCVIEYFYFSNPLYGANIPPVYEAIAFSLLLPVVIFAASYSYHKSKGIDIMKAFKQIPPE